MTPNYNKTFTVKFWKELKGEGPHQIAGSWSVVGTDPVTGAEVRVELDPVTVSY